MPHHCALGCNNSGVLHSFPNPDKFPERFQTWVKVVGGKLETPSDYQFYRQKKICAIHFIHEHKNRFKRLNALAVPTLFLPGAYMHRFPHPEKRAEMFSTWLSIADGKLKGSDPMKIYKNKRICDYHFKPEHKVSSHRLIGSAVPSLHLSGVHYSNGIAVQLEHNYYLPRMWLTDNPNLREKSSQNQNILDEELLYDCQTHMEKFVGWRR